MTPEERASKWFADWFAPGSESKERLIQTASGAIREAEAATRLEALEALEEAAKIAENMMLHSEEFDDEHTGDLRDLCKATASAIRALAEGKV